MAMFGFDHDGDIPKVNCKGIDIAIDFSGDFSE
jgi:hypothetical protein